ncbi:MAG TPA: hypothetical protein PLD20_20780 [Blastocatellia bacterium]|nr:hypothetical protein [Blastocatellia bacterium]HMX26012.1 hypothetical protein [Blastocatellia bacterium]HMY72406.1 hypothetical protein [Blastocatellia bacterium]HMZ20384.1 hypothetical protein [Blastocatellia bacterium]HNG31854.1 hypothetical protein [Blastocatellia bacterium]
MSTETIDPNRPIESFIHEAGPSRIPGYQDCRRCGAPLEAPPFPLLNEGNLVEVQPGRRVLFESFPGAPYRMCAETLKEKPLLTTAQLRKIMPGLAEATAASFLPHLLKALAEFEINTPVRMTAFLAQIGHESGGLRFWAEMWGPTEAQRRYEGRKDLGNTQPGDGKRFKGRGPIQITGRKNYREYGLLLNLPLIDRPELLEQPEHGFRSAGAYWQKNALNALADKNTSASFRVITQRINGGENGLADRLNYWQRAKEALNA